MTEQNLDSMNNNYRLATAHILYHLPDFPNLLQDFIWQTMDLTPAFPAIQKFLEYWQRNLEGDIHSVDIACARPLERVEYRWVATELPRHLTRH